MNRIYLFLLFFAFALEVHAQKCNDYNYLNEGTYWEMTNYDKKGKVESVGAYLVKSKQNTTLGIKWSFNVVLKDKKEKETNNYNFDVECENGVIKFDMMSVIDPATMQAYQDMDIKISSESLEYPAKLYPGMTLKDGTVNVKAFMGDMPLLNMDINVVGRLIESYEDITVPAGTFKAYKIIQTTKVTTKLIKKEVSSIDYYVPGFGVIKSITLNKKGEVDTYSELTAYKK